MESGRIIKFGWRGDESVEIGRVVSAHGDYYHLVCNEAQGEVLARKKKSAFRDRHEMPITGDFVRFRYNAQGESMITEVLPRYSKFERRDPTARRQVQILAVNFDTLFIMMSHTENFSLARLERYLALAEDVGDAEVVVILSKSDLVSEAERAEKEKEIACLQDTASRFTFLSISVMNGVGMEKIRGFFSPRKTIAIIGSSGVGKSSLVNALAGEDWMPTQEIQEWSGKGRHTTTSRELLMLPSGAMVIDTPGIREIGMVGEEDELLVKGESTHRYRK